MSTNGNFEIDDCDIVRLEGRLDGESTDYERTGWVNVGRFAVRIELDATGDLTIGAYALGNEDKPFGTITASRAEALAAGAMTPQDEADVEADQGPFLVMLNGDQSAAQAPTLEEARIEARRIFDTEPLPTFVSIENANGDELEDLGRSPGTEQGRAALAKHKPAL